MPHDLTGYRRAPVIALEPNPTYPGAHLVTIECPWCHGHHVHGIPAGEDLTQECGHRVAHCINKPPHNTGYVIEAPEGA